MTAATRQDDLRLKARECRTFEPRLADMTEQLNLATPERVDWRRAEFALTLFAFAGFITLLIRIKTVWGGLPAHPLFIHVPAVLVPVTVLAVLLCTVRPSTFERYGILICAVAIVAMSSIFLAMQAGAALEGALHLQGQALHLISEHAAAAKVLAVAFTLLTATVILNFASYRIRGGMPTGLALADDLLGSEVIALLLRVVMVALTIVSAYYVFRVGDLGARAVWEGKLQAAAHLAGPGRFGPGH